MDLGKILSFISPAAGMITGQGLGQIMPFLSPGLGMMSGQGPFGNMLGGGDEEEEPGANPRISDLLARYDNFLGGGGGPQNFHAGGY